MGSLQILARQADQQSSKTCRSKMGSSHSTEQGSEVDNDVVKKPKRVQRKVNIERLPVVEEVFVKEVAYKCGITKDEVDTKKVAYLHHVKKNPERGLVDFTNLYRDLKRNKSSKKKQIAHTVFRPTSGTCDQSTYNSMILAAITALGDSKGSSSQSIVKNILANNNQQDTKKVKLALERMRELQELVMVGKKGAGLYKLNVNVKF